ncbi:DUF917 domain-containing protein [Sphingosinicella soli]|uniref:DUF917 domain-containing protein n=1 Tax=Sphingosinicella soli TaxID=333708 RepID=A0A7W7B4C1_9SPHN|nr:DUF917 domain-containing protein [Sphingosinicella soli]MBB4633747.1 hypothetical protein [Sphingosinicella soli]
MKRIDIADVADIATGAALLGAGGGGDPYIGRLMVEEAIRAFGPVQLVDVDSVPDEALIVPTAMMGAPSVMVEKLPNGAEAEIALEAVETAVGKRAHAIIAPEIGGLNAMLPIVLAARRGLPLVDGDGMGRAFPELPMVTFNIFGQSISPLAISDELGNCVTVRTVDVDSAERLGRQIVVAMGAAAQICCYPMTGAEAKRSAVRGTVRLAWEIGRLLRVAREQMADPFEALLTYLPTTDYYKHCRSLFDGRIVDLRREIAQGFTVGTVEIENTAQARISIQFRNEYLVARQAGKAIVIVPDLIAILDSETASPITAEALKYGQRVRVIGISAPPILRSEAALRVVGPQAFGFTDPFQPIEEMA